MHLLPKFLVLVLASCLKPSLQQIYNYLQVEERGGKCIPVQCDHSNEEEIEKLFEKIKSEQDGQLDVLVNNAYSGAKV